MNEDLLERLTIAAQASTQLVGDLRHAHNGACGDETALLEILLRDALTQAAELNRRIGEIKSAAEAAVRK